MSGKSFPWCLEINQAPLGHEAGLDPTGSPTCAPAASISQRSPSLCPNRAGLFAALCKSHTHSQPSTHCVGALFSTYLHGFLLLID